MSVVENEIGGLEGFAGWDDDTTTTEESFFEDTFEKIGGSEDPEPEPEKSAKEEILEEKESLEVEDEADVFGDFEEPGVEESSDDENDLEAPEKSISSTLGTLEYLKSKGYADYELEEGTELTEELAAEILEDSLEDSLDKRVEELFTDLPPLVKQLNKFTLDGGNPIDFINALKTPSGISADMDIEDTSNQEKVMRELLAQEDHDQDYIDTQIEFLKDSGKLAKIAKTKYDKWQKSDEERRETLNKQQEERKRQIRENRKAAKSSVTKIITSNEGVDGIKFSREEKKELPSYLSDYTIKTEGGRQITAFQRDLYSAMQDEKKAALLAKIIKSDFNFKDFERKAKTEVAQKERDSIRRVANATPKKGASSSTRERKSLADLLE